MSIKKTISLLSTSHKGIANGVAELNESGTIPNSQLPSGVYDVIEGSMNEDLTEFTDVSGDIVTPETGKIYMDTSSINGLCYRYTGSEFVSLTTSSSGTGSANIIELTQAEYDALSEEDKMLDVLYLIKDADGGASVIKASATNDGFMSKEDKVKLDSLVMDENGVLNANNLPSYVDDVIEGTISSDESTFTDTNGETITPESGKIYVDVTKNQSYRWSGTVYVSVGKDLALGETSETAYAGDKGKALSDKIGTTDISDIGTSVTDAITKLNAPTFTSSDVADGSATSWTSVTKLASGEKQSSIFAKMSQMFKNIRYLYKKLGTTDISSIGDGSVTGAISSLNSNLRNMISQSNSGKFIISTTGLKIYWGTTDSIGLSNHTTTITFSTPFINTNYAVILSHSGAESNYANSQATIVGKTKSDVSISAYAIEGFTDGMYKYDYIVIGY